MSRYALTSFGNSQELASHVAEMWLDYLQSRGNASLCSMALSGGRISAALYQAFAEKARARKVALDHVHFFWADERCVASDHTESNYYGAQRNLLGPLEIPAERIHRIKGELPPPVAAARASEDITAFLSAAPLPKLDLIFLGMGEDGHVASLFPNNPQCRESTDIYCSVRGPKPPPDRVTLSYAMISAAHDVWVIVSGDGKADALRESLAVSGSTPLARVIQNRPTTQVFTEGANFA